MMILTPDASSNTKVINQEIEEKLKNKTEMRLEVILTKEKFFCQI